MGVIGGGIDYSRTHPRRDPAAAQRFKMMQRRFSMSRDVSAMRMHPFHLDTIANNFPRLPLIGAHMGGTGNYDAASSVARWRANVHFDLSGGETIEQHAVERGLIGREIGVEKLVWGSDCGIEEIQEHVDRFVKIFEDLKLSEDEVDRIWYRNAAEMFGEEEPQFAEE
jgi:predicted TIM-barrel fold metal-dependent hydrolase